MSKSIKRSTLFFKIVGSDISLEFTEEDLKTFFKEKLWKVSQFERHDAPLVVLKSPGRPRTIDEEKIKEMALTMTPYRISKELNISYRSVQRYFQKLGLKKEKAA